MFQGMFTMACTCEVPELRDEKVVERNLATMSDTPDLHRPKLPKATVSSQILTSSQISIPLKSHWKVAMKVRRTKQHMSLLRLKRPTKSQLHIRNLPKCTKNLPKLDTNSLLKCTKSLNQLMKNQPQLQRMRLLLILISIGMHARMDTVMLWMRTKITFRRFWCQRLLLSNLYFQSTPLRSTSRLFRDQ